MGSKLRESNIELLRIVAMFLVVLSHFYVHGRWPIVETISFNNVAIYALDVGEIGVTAFVLISGYFLIEQSFDLTKLVKLVLQMWFYGIGLLVFAYMFDTRVITSKYFWGSILPFYSLNWFAKAYLLLYLLFPVLNRFVKYYNQRKLEAFILVFGFVWTVLPACWLYEYGNQRVTLMFIYCIGAYFCIYGCKLLENIKRAFVLSLVSYLTILGTVILLWEARLQNPFFIGKQASFLALNSVLVLLCGIGLFFIFKTIRLESTNVNRIAKTMFGVYLIHDNPLISAWIWNGVLRIHQFYNSDFLIPISVICSVLVMIACSCIDYLRIEFIEKPLFAKISPMLRTIQDKISLMIKDYYKEKC